MLQVEVTAPSVLEPNVSHAVDLLRLERAAIEQRASLHVYALPGTIVSIGRYHLAPAGDSSGRVLLHRRLCGGRVVALGRGFAVLSLALPHRSALVSEDPLALRPEQVVNRCVRAILGGLRSVGVEAFYPGRDAVTVAGRTVGWVSLESDARGATLFEMLLALDGDWSSAGAAVAAVDPAGVLGVELMGAGQVTTLDRQGVRPSLEALTDSVSESFAQQFGLARTLARALHVSSGFEASAAAWVAARCRGDRHDRHAAEWGQMGVFEVWLAARDGLIEDVMLAGDFIANSPSIERLETRLRGCRLDAPAIAAAVDEVYADPTNFLLGLGSLRSVVDAILRAAESDPGR